MATRTLFSVTLRYSALSCLPWRSGQQVLPRHLHLSMKQQKSRILEYRGLKSLEMWEMLRYTNIYRKLVDPVWVHHRANISKPADMGRKTISDVAIGRSRVRRWCGKRRGSHMGILKVQLANDHLIMPSVWRIYYSFVFPFFVSGMWRQWRNGCRLFYVLPERELGYKTLCSVIMLVESWYTTNFTYSGLFTVK